MTDTCMTDTITTRSRVLAVLVTLLAVASLATAAGATAAAPIQQQPLDADLAIQQPAYVDAPVEERSANGTRMYVVQGEQFSIKPQNFATDDVVDFGVEAPAGQMDYDAEMDLYRFDPEGNAGTFTVYWVVTEQVETDDGNNSTTTETVQRRYEAVVNVDGQATLHHLTDDELAEYEGAVALVNKLDSELPEEWTVDRLVTGYKLRYEFSSYLTGNFTEIGVLLVLGGIGGWLWLLLWLVTTAWTAWSERREKHEYVTAESVEGDQAARQVTLDRRDREQTFANVDHEHWFTDTEASVLREIEDTPERVWRTLEDGPLNPSVLYLSHLQAMGDVGWRAIVDRDGDDAESPITDADLLAPDADDPEDAETVDLTDLTTAEAVLPHVVGADAIRDFDFVGASFDDSVLDIDMDRLDPENLTDAIDWDAADEGLAAELLHDLLRRTEDHPYTDEFGQPETLREVLNVLLEFSYRVRDEVGDPNASMAADLVERALRNDDPNQRAHKLDREVRQGVSGD